jgi:NACalpha-BTF3-like transcription factor
VLDTELTVEGEESDLQVKKATSAEEEEEEEEEKEEEEENIMLVLHRAKVENEEERVEPLSSYTTSLSN